MLLMASKVLRHANSHLGFPQSGIPKLNLVFNYAFSLPRSLQPHYQLTHSFPSLSFQATVLLRLFLGLGCLLSTLLHKHHLRDTDERLIVSFMQSTLECVL